MEELEPEDVRPLGRLPQPVGRLAELEVVGELGVGPEPVLPAGVQAPPGLALPP